MPRPSTTLLALASALGLALPLVSFGQPASAAVLPPANPPDSQPSSAMQSECNPPSSILVCDQASLTSINAARAMEGVGPIALPSNYYSLSAPEQLLTVLDLERVDRGLAPFEGLNAYLDSLALDGALDGDDPPLPPSASASSIWLGGYADALYDDFYWMYDDGPGGVENSCCWAHRDAILASYAGSPSQVEMGAAVADAAGYPDSTAVVVASGQTGSTFTWSDEIPYLQSNERIGGTDLGAAPGQSTSSSMYFEPSGESGTYSASLSGGYGEFSLSSTSCSAGAGQWCRLGVQYAPWSTVPVTATLSVSGPGGTKNFSLQGGPPSGYWLSTSNGGVLSYGTSQFYGSMGGTPLPTPMVDVIATDDHNGYWEISADGGVFSFGDAPFLGSKGNRPTLGAIVGAASDPDAAGYWLVTTAGQVYNFGSAGFYGSEASSRLGSPIVGMATTPDGKGYYLVSANGAVFAFGDATWFGSPQFLSHSPIVAIEPTLDDRGYWLVSSHGGVFSYGDAPFDGSAVPYTTSPVSALVRDWDGGGYWLMATNGAVFSFGDAAFHGSAFALHLAVPVVSAGS